MPATARLAATSAASAPNICTRSPCATPPVARRRPRPTPTLPPRAPHARAAPRSLSGSDLAKSASPPIAFPSTLLAEYELEGMLDRQGSFGTVVAARRRAPAGAAACAPARVAVKVLSKSPTAPPRFGGASVSQAHIEERIMEEVTILRALQHVPEAVQLIDVFETPAALFLVTEMAAGGDLEAALRVSPTGSLPSPAVAAIAHDALQVLAAAHGLGITYGDWKPANILLAAPLPARGGAGLVAARLADFGCASRRAGAGAPPPPSSPPPPPRPRATGTPLFLPPEALLLAMAGPPVDMYSLGAVLYLALTGVPPLPAPPRLGCGAWAGGSSTAPPRASPSPSDLLASLLSDDIAFGGHPALDADPAAAAFLARLLDPDWEARPSAAAALADPWLAGVRAARAGPRAAAAAARVGAGAGG